MLWFLFGKNFIFNWRKLIVLVDFFLEIISLQTQFYSLILDCLVCYVKRNLVSRATDFKMKSEL